MQDSTPESVHGNNSEGPCTRLTQVQSLETN